MNRLIYNATRKLLWDGETFPTPKIPDVNERFVFYDFEVFAHDWLVVCIDRLGATVVHNDRPGFCKYVDGHKDCVWVGYNSVNYDSVVMNQLMYSKNAITPEVMKDINDSLIEGGSDARMILMEEWYKKPAQFDCVRKYKPGTRIPEVSLKEWESRHGFDIVETPVDFHIDRKLTDEELQTVIHYCRCDVEATIACFNTPTVQADFIAVERLVKETGEIRYYWKTAAQCADWYFKDDVKPLGELVLPSYGKLGPTAALLYEQFAEPFKDNDPNAECSFTMKIHGVDHQFGVGGCHNFGNENIDVTGDDSVHIFDIDAASYYPNILRAYDLVHSPSYYKMIDDRVAIKKSDPVMANCMKLLLNSLSGQFRQTFAKVFSPFIGHSVCIIGQILLVDFIDMLEDADVEFELLNSNTDGVYIKTAANVQPFMDAWADKWSIAMEAGEFKRLVARDVNNYVAVGLDGTLKIRGALGLKTAAKAVCDCAVSLLTTGEKKWSTDVRDYLLHGGIPKGKSAVMYGDDVFAGKRFRYAFTTDGKSLHYSNRNKSTKKNQLGEFAKINNVNVSDKVTMYNTTIPTWIPLDMRKYRELVDDLVYAFVNGKKKK